MLNMLKIVEEIYEHDDKKKTPNRTAKIKII